MMGTDTHCHVDRFADPDAVLERAEAEGVTVFAVTFVPSDLAKERRVYGAREKLHLGLGFHPMAASGVVPWVPDPDIDRELEIFQASVGNAPFVGEIGLDFTPMGIHARNAQNRVFDTILATPGVTDMFLTVHARGAETEVVDRLRDVEARCAVLHGNGFIGSPAQMERGMEAGLYLSIVPPMLFTPEGRAVISVVPPERLLFESDGPFGQVEGKECEPRDFALVRDYLAAQWNTTAEAVASALAENLARIWQPPLQPLPNEDAS